MKSIFNSPLVFTRTQRLGIVILITLIFLLQSIILFADFPSALPKTELSGWLKFQAVIDSEAIARRLEKPKIYPFNPNFITDYKGYRLGMSLAEIDRLHAFRKKNLYVNSAEDFQKVTRVSDSLLHAISPYFKFPDWVMRKKSPQVRYPDGNFAKKAVVKSDINEATKEQLVAVYGIGDALSERILKQKDMLGGFVSMDQMKDVWGLSDEVIDKLRERFSVMRVPTVKKININAASVKELAAFPYFRYKVAKSIVTFRSMNGKITNADDLVKIDNFPVDNVKIISLYLEY